LRGAGGRGVGKWEEKGGAGKRIRGNLQKKNGGGIEMPGPQERKGPRKGRKKDKKPAMPRCPEATKGCNHCKPVDQSQNFFGKNKGGVKKEGKGPLVGKR